VLIWRADEVVEEEEVEDERGILDEETMRSDEAETTPARARTFATRCHHRSVWREEGSGGGRKERKRAER